MRWYGDPEGREIIGLASLPIAPGIAVAMSYAENYHDLKAYALRKVFKAFEGFRFPPKDQCGSCSRDYCEECESLAEYYQNADWRAKPGSYSEALLRHCSPGFAAAAAVYLLMASEKDRFDLPKAWYPAEFTEKQLVAMACAELLDDPWSSWNERPWVRAALWLEGPIEEFEGSFVELLEAPNRELMRSLLAGKTTAFDRVPEDHLLVFVIARANCDYRNELVELYASLIANQDETGTYSAWLEGPLKPQIDL
ncbi:hypothetical protein BH11ARM1_BH11ARM1_11090 [soil metagenome]